MLVDGDLVLAESAVILRYLNDRYGKGRFAPARASIRIGYPARDRLVKCHKPGFPVLYQVNTLAQHLALGVVAAGPNKLGNEAFELLAQISADRAGAPFDETQHLTNCYESSVSRKA